MYYDVPNHVGTVLNADVLTPVPNYQGLLRLHADVLQQTAQDRYFAKDAFLTSSRMGEPGYRLQANDVYFEDLQHPVIDPLTGLPLVDPERASRSSSTRGWPRRTTISSSSGRCRSSTGPPWPPT